MKTIEQHLKGAVMASAGAALLLSAPGMRADVELVPGHIVGTVTIGTEAIDYMHMRAYNASDSATQTLSPGVPAAPFDLTVNVPTGTMPTYTVRADNIRTRDNTVPPYDYDYLSFPTQTVAVSETTPATSDFELAVPNHAEGTVTLTGSGELQYMYIYANPVTYSGFSHYTYQLADNDTRNALSFEFPISSGDMNCNGTAYLTDGTGVPLPNQVVSPVGGVVTCDWEIATPESGDIVGTIEFQGPETVDRFYVYTSGPTSRYWNVNSPDNPDDFLLNDLSLGNYNVYSYAYLNGTDDQFYFPNASFDPQRSTTIEAGDSDAVDITACQSFIGGSIELTGAATWEDLNHGEIRVSGLYNPALPDYGPSAGGFSRDRLTVTDGHYDLVVSPGEWYANYIYLAAYRAEAEGYINHPLYIYDRSVMYTDNPANPAACGTEVARNFAYSMGEVTVNFSVAGGDLMSDPRLSGFCSEYDDGGALLYQYNFSSINHPQDNVSEGFVTFVAPSGDCTGLRAEALVSGTRTTFGEIDLEVIGGGEVIIDIGGPGLTIAEPEANLCLDAEETTVIGTATDDVGVASVTVNGVAAALTPAGGEGVLSTDFSAAIGLVNGANSVETIATDTSGKTGTDTRTIYRDGGPPSLDWLPLNGATTTFFTIDVEGIVSDDVGVDSVTVNGVSASLSATGNPGEYAFGVPISLVLGSNTITVAVTEETGCAEVVEVREITVVENEPPTADAGGPYLVDEGSSVGLDGSASSDPDGDALTYEWDFDYDGVTFDVDASGSATPTFPADALDGPLEVTVALRVSDPDGASSLDTALVTVDNVAPEVGDISFSEVLVPVDTEISASADFTDAGTADTHTATWDWGDASEPGTVTESGGGGSVEDTRTYTEPGVYTIELTVLDDDGASASAAYQYVVVYDPDGSFVTGGGTIDSPPGAYVDGPELTGIANFGFVSKYKKGASVPIGHTQFQFHAAGMDFSSTEYQWLVVAGARAQFKGAGTIGGREGTFGFMLTAIDGQQNGGGGTDKFRIKIWDESDESIVIYDNQVGDDDDAAVTTALRSGSIVIHK